MSNYSIPEPSPITTNEPSIHDLLIEHLSKRKLVSPLIPHIEDRKQFGLQKYGTILQASNGRDHRNDIFQELLDALIYTQQGIEKGDVRLIVMRSQLENLAFNLLKIQELEPIF
jgi:hypothetical protein